MVDLGQGLRKALSKLTGAVIVDDKAVKELVKELQRVLISNDVNIKLVFDLSKSIEKRALEEKPLPGISMREHVVKVVYEELTKLMGEKYEPQLKKHRVLMLGLFGSGKTTTAGKMALHFKSRGLSVGVICADTFRPAAFEQLQQLCSQVKADFYGEKGTLSAVEVVNHGLEKFRDKDVVIVDSSGRSAFDEELSAELKAINAVLNAEEKYLVLSADIGQVAGRQAEAFNSAVGISGVIVTKLDGSGKGGGALSAVSASGAKIAFIGTGEKMDALELFDAKKFVGRLLGFPDLETLMDKMKKITEEQNLKPEMLEEKFTIKMFYEQLKAAKKMGPLQGVFSMLGAPDVPKEMVQQSEEKLKKYEVIINSMTRQEREDAGILRKHRSRVERIANGSGTKPEDVRELLAQFERVEKMMDAFKKNRGFRRQIEKLMKGGQLGMKLPGMGGKN